MLLLCLYEQFVECGLLGTPSVQIKVTNWAEPAVRAALRASIAACARSAPSLVVVVVEPPLFDIRIKQLLADLLLQHFGVKALVFLPRSVCCVAGEDVDSALVQDTEFLVPVYDLRELTTNIRVRGEFSDEEVARAIRDSAPIDLRRSLQRVLECGNASVWRGAEKLTRERNLWPVLTLRTRVRVWDQLYDWE